MLGGDDLRARCLPEDPAVRAGWPVRGAAFRPTLDRKADGQELPMTAQTTLPKVQDPREPVNLLMRDLRCGTDGLSAREVQRRLVVYGPNELSRRAGRRWWRELAGQ